MDLHLHLKATCVCIHQPFCGKIQVLDAQSDWNLTGKGAKRPRQVGFKVVTDGDSCPVITGSRRTGAESTRGGGNDMPRSRWPHWRRRARIAGSIIPHPTPPPHLAPPRQNRENRAGIRTRERVRGRGKRSCRSRGRRSYNATGSVTAIHHVR